MKRRIDPLSKVREACVCGAVLEYEGTQPRGAAADFRFDHEACRRTRLLMSDDKAKRSESAIGRER
jgi:hypothetical protein